MKEHHHQRMLQVFVLTFFCTSFPKITYASIYTLHEMEQKGCTYKNISVDLNADIVIGALFPIHHYLTQKYTFNVNSIAWVESFLFAINQINHNPNLLPNVTLGYVVKDTCNDEELALRQALSFMVDVEYFRNKTNSTCLLPTRNETICECSQNKRNIIASTIGCDLSSVSHYVSMLTSTDYMPQISPFSVDLQLSKMHNFLRTIPSDIYQTTAIADLLQYFNWTYISVLGSDNDYGRFALDNLVGKMKDRGMCTAVEKIFDPHFPSNDMEKLINDLKEISSRSNVIVLWCDVNEAIHIINETHNAGLTNITWIGTEIWGTHRDLRKLSLTIPHLRLISLSMETDPIPAFEKHFKKIDYYSNLNNPWFVDLWDQLYRCKPTEENKTNKQTNKFCTHGYPKTDAINTLQHENVMYAVYAIAYGLHSYLNCTNSVCHNKSKPIDYRSLLQHIKNVSFSIPTSSSVFTFNKKGEKTFTSYTYSVRKFNNVSGRQKRLGFADLGRWNGTTKSCTINMTVLNITWEYKALPKAKCSEACEPGSFKVNGSTSCCWKCPKCAENEISTTYNQQRCHRCKTLETSNDDNTVCVPLKDLRLSINTIIGQILTAFSLLGIICILWVVSVLRKHWESPVVKSSSREISFIQLMLMLILFCLPVLDMIDVSEAICIAKTSIFGVLYSQIIAFIVMKTYRLYCVFNVKQFTQISKFLRNKYQIFFSFLLVIPQFVLIIVWYNINQLNVEARTFITRKSFIRHCGANEDTLIYAMTGYIVFLSLIGGLMAFRARKLPENFKETLTIFYAMFTNIFLWFPMFLLCYRLSPARDKQIIVFIIINIIGNFCLLVILYGSKLIIILLYPELNSKEHFRQMAASNTMLTFLKDVDPKTFGQKRVSQQAVLEYDFDAMFDEYKEKQLNSLPQAKITLSNTIKRLDRHMTFKKRNSNTSKAKVSPLRERKHASNLQHLQNISDTLHEDEIVNKPSNYDDDDDDDHRTEHVQINYQTDKVKKTESLKLTFQLPKSSSSSSYNITENKTSPSSLNQNDNNKVPLSPSYSNNSPSQTRKVCPPSPLCKIDISDPLSPSYTIGKNVVIHNVIKSPSYSNSSQTLEVPPSPSYQDNSSIETKSNSLYEGEYLSRENSIISLIRKQQRNKNESIPQNIFEFPQTMEATRKDNKTIITNL